MGPALLSLAYVGDGILAGSPTSHSALPAPLPFPVTPGTAPRVPKGYRESQFPQSDVRPDSVWTLKSGETPADEGLLPAPGASDR